MEPENTEIYESNETQKNEVPQMTPSGIQKLSKVRFFLKFFNVWKKKQPHFFRKTVYHSGDMVSIIMVQKHIRKWIRNTRKKMKIRFINLVKILNKLTNIIEVNLKQVQLEDYLILKRKMIWMICSI